MNLFRLSFLLLTFFCCLKNSNKFYDMLLIWTKGTKNIKISFKTSRYTYNYLAHISVQTKKRKKNLSEKIYYILYIFSKKVFLIFLGKKVSYVSLRNVLPTFWNNQVVKKKKKKKKDPLYSTATADQAKK